MFDAGGDSTSDGLRRQFALFGVVGALGFAVDAALFFVLTSRWAWPVAGARAVSASCSIATTWALNRTWTFAARKSPRAAAELVRYALVQVAGLAVNFGVFAACLAASAALRRTPVIALAVGAAAALAFNFVSARTIAFRRRAHAS